MNSVTTQVGTELNQMYMCVLKMVNEAHVKVISVDKQHIDFLETS